MRSEPKQHRSLESRKAVVQAAIELGCERGYDRARTRDIARAAYISEGGMFRHFHSKADLFADAFEQAAVALIQDHTDTFVTALRGGDAGRLEHGIRVVMDDPRVLLMVDVLSATQFDDDLATRMNETLERLERHVVGVVADVTDGVGDRDALDDMLRRGFEQLLGRALVQRARGQDLSSDPVVSAVALRLLEALPTDV